MNHNDVAQLDAEDILKIKRLHYGDIHECPMSQMLIAARMLDKTRRIIQLEYLNQVKRDFGDIPEVSSRLRSLNTVEEDSIKDLSNYVTMYEEGRTTN